jgi:hypothetical protein
MRRIVIATALLSLAAAGVFAFLSPGVLEWRVERACPQIAESCFGRARALAHLWAYKGEAERAKLWYRKAAEAGDPMSMFHLAWMIEQKAVDIYQAKSFDAAALGKAPNLQAELRPQFDAAAAWYRKSAEKGFAPAMNNLGQIHARGLLGVRNPQMAAHYYRLAAQAGNPVAGFNLALAHLHGDGVAQSSSETEKWIEWSPSKKFSEADLQQPTLERTRINGGMLTESLRKKLRAAADSGPPATAKFEFRPLQPVASLPTFEQVRRQSGAPLR